MEGNETQTESKYIGKNMTGIAQKRKAIAQDSTDNLSCKYDEGNANRPAETGLIVHFMGFIMFHMHFIVPHYRGSVKSTKKPVYLWQYPGLHPNCCQRKEADQYKQEQ
jgi:hypothetical protein